MYERLWTAKKYRVSTTSQTMDIYIGESYKGKGMVYPGDDIIASRKASGPIRRAFFDIRFISMEKEIATVLNLREKS